MIDSSADPYSEALTFLYRRINYEQTATVPYRDRELNLDRMRELLERLGNPHLQVPIVHIAGTKGKGSTANMLHSILQAAGYRVGLYTSPHLLRLEERFVVDGEPCSREELVELTHAIRDAAPGPDDSSPSPSPRLTFFDVTTAMGFLHFARRQVDIVVLEVGLGGRLDSTNVCQPLLSVITSISFDHTRQLGNTLAAIAGEKAGIIKPGVPVISGVTEPEPAETIGRVAREKGSRLYQHEREYRVEYFPPAGPGPGAASYREPEGVSAWSLERARLGMLGRHQALNAGVALAAIQRLRESGWSIPDESCRTGLASARCPARIEVVATRPTVLIDAAHNDASISALAETLRAHFRQEHRVLIFAVARDKDARTLLGQLLPLFSDVILTQFVSNPRGLPLAELTPLAHEVLSSLPRHSVRLTSAPTVAEAWERSAALATPESLICLTGSFFLVAEWLQLVSGRQAACQRDSLPLALSGAP